MLYYYSLLRYHIANQLHIRNRRNLDKSWNDVIEMRRILRVMNNKDSYVKKLKRYNFINLY